jgi:putative addiction module killer protein
LAKFIHPRKVFIYADQNGEEPFTNWLKGLQDLVARKRILARVTRLEYGNFGDCEPVGDGVRELRMFFGPGYRVYFGEEKDRIGVLLCGGHKQS